MLGASLRGHESFRGRGSFGRGRSNRTVAEHYTKGADLDALVPPPTPSASSQAGSSIVGREVPKTAPRAAVGVSTLCNINKSPENQDSFITSSNPSGSKCLIGVFDGHGEKGKRISEFAKVQIAKNLFNSKELHSNPASALEGAYFDAQRQIERMHSGEAFHSGTTAIAAYQHRDRLFIANVGDSRAVLGRSNSREGGDGLRAVELSSDQRPGRSDERKRILSAGGVVQQSQYPVRQVPGGPPRLMRLGPERVWDRTGCCGLCVTRSLGDIAMQPFVVACPEIHEKQIEVQDKFLILGSDGVWDRLQSQEAVDIAARHNDPSAAAREITDVARQRWHHETQGHVSDDITAVVMRLDHSSRARDPASLDANNAQSRRASLEPANGKRPESVSTEVAVRRASRPTSLSTDAAMRLTGRSRRRVSDGFSARNRKLPVHNWTAT